MLRAYARKLRETRPEDDPEGFQRLLAAREQALAWRERTPRHPLAGDAEDFVGPPAETADRRRRRSASSWGPRCPRRPRTKSVGADRVGPIGGRTVPPRSCRRPSLASTKTGVGARRASNSSRRLPAPSAPDEVAALRARWLALSREADEVFWRLEAWEEILRRAGALAILERETVRRELAALFAGRCLRSPIQGTSAPQISPCSAGWRRSST